jgi:hypothetical protein
LTKMPGRKVSKMKVVPWLSHLALSYLSNLALCHDR